MSIGPQTKLIFQTYIESDDDQGSTTEEWMEIGNINGTFISIKGEERYATDRITVVKTHYFLIDYPKTFDVNFDDRFVNMDDTKTYEIIDIIDIGASRGISLKITLLEKIK